MDDNGHSPSLFAELDEPAGPWDLENFFCRDGHGIVAGVDEAGRGPLAGPVVAAAVVLNTSLEYPFVNDSKKMTPEERERAFWLIQRMAVDVRVGLAEPGEIDRINILQASLLAMARAVGDMKVKPDGLLIDGPYGIPLDIPQRPVKGGDAKSLSIGAASIVAKVYRDRLMVAFDRCYPGYGFAGHKGYGTKAHLTALAKIGPCPLHRLSFKGVVR